MTTNPFKMSKIEQLQAEGRREFEERYKNGFCGNCHNSDCKNHTSKDLLSFQDSLIARAFEEGRKVDENTSDGYHTFKELYEFRLLYNAHLFNEWAAQGKYDVHKSQRHNDGELCFGRNDYFVVVATLPFGQISNHYPMSDWDLFKCEAVDKAKVVWDGHSSQDVATRLRLTLSSN